MCFSKKCYCWWQEKIENEDELEDCAYFNPTNKNCLKLYSRYIGAIAQEHFQYHVTAPKPHEQHQAWDHFVSDLNAGPYRHLKDLPGIGEMFEEQNVRSDVFMRIRKMQLNRRKLAGEVRGNKGKKLKTGDSYAGTPKILSRRDKKKLLKSAKGVSLSLSRSLAVSFSRALAPSGPRTHTHLYSQVDWAKHHPGNEADGLELDFSEEQDNEEGEVSFFSGHTIGQACFFKPIV
jgi:hypothetical protein